jgi:hypothetical protein
MVIRPLPPLSRFSLQHFGPARVFVVSPKLSTLGREGNVTKTDEAFTARLMV